MRHIEVTVQLISLFLSFHGKGVDADFVSHQEAMRIHDYGGKFYLNVSVRDDYYEKISFGIGEGNWTQIYGCCSPLGDKKLFHQNKNLLFEVFANVKRKITRERSGMTLQSPVEKKLFIEFDLVVPSILVARAVRSEGDYPGERNAFNQNERNAGTKEGNRRVKRSLIKTIFGISRRQKRRKRRREKEDDRRKMRGMILEIGQSIGYIALSTLSSILMENPMANSSVDEVDNSTTTENDFLPDEISLSTENTQSSENALLTETNSFLTENANLMKINAGLIRNDISLLVETIRRGNELSGEPVTQSGQNLYFLSESEIPPQTDSYFFGNTEPFFPDGSLGEKENDIFNIKTSEIDDPNNGLPLPLDNLFFENDNSFLTSDNLLYEADNTFLPDDQTLLGSKDIFEENIFVPGESPITLEMDDFSINEKILEDGQELFLPHYIPFIIE